MSNTIMDLIAEISLYPLQDDYLTIIKTFIERLNHYPKLKVITNPMSTQLSGDYDTIMQVISHELKACANDFGKATLVCKFIPKV